MIVVAPLFRSRRPALACGATIGSAGAEAWCEPVQGLRGASTWTRSSHGILVVVKQWLKLQ